MSSILIYAPIYVVLSQTIPQADDPEKTL